MRVADARIWNATDQKISREIFRDEVVRLTRVHARCRIVPSAHQQPAISKVFGADHHARSIQPNDATLLDVDTDEQTIHAHGDSAMGRCDQ